MEYLLILALFITIPVCVGTITAKLLQASALPTPVSAVAVLTAATRHRHECCL